MKKILIIDDDKESIAVFEYLLSNLNYNITSISNPLMAVNTIIQTAPDLIILDLVMPQKEGLEILKEIKANPLISEIPVVIVSGVRTQSNYISETLSAGSIDFIKKPIDEIEFKARVASNILIYSKLKNARQNVEECHNEELKTETEKTKYYQNELSKREREMILSTVTIFQNRKLIGVLKSEMTSNLIGFSEQQKSQLLNVLDRYENIANSFNWELFERRFTELSAGFYVSLKADYPTLTFGEQQICAFFKLGLTMREISILNYSTYEAVRKAVQRLRKKMHLNPKTELNIFLQGY